MEGGYGGGGYDAFASAEAGWTAAFKDSRPSRTTYILLALTQQALAGGVIFGWQALLPVLYDYGVFAQSCEGETDDPKKHPCLKMRAKLSLVFSIACSATAIGGLVAGLIMDYAGTRVARLFSAGIVLAGALMLSYAEPESIMWFPGLAAMGFGGNGIQITSFHISNLFQGNEKLVVSLIAGAFAASSSLFTFMRLLHDAYALDMRTLFLGYSGICGVVFLTSVVWPDKPFTSHEDLEKPVEEEGPFRKLERSESCYSITESMGIESRDSSMHGVMNQTGSDREMLFEALLDHFPEKIVECKQENHLCLDLSNLSLRQQLLTSTFFLTAIGDQLQCVTCGCGGRCWDTTCLHACSQDHILSGNQWLMVFGIIYPLGFITTPFCGYLQDRYQLSTVFIFVNFTFLLWEVATMVPIIQVQAAGMVFFSMSRQFLFSFFFAAVGSTFGYENFGFLTGLANAVSAGVLMLNAPLYELTASRFFDTYVAFVGATCVFFLVAAYFRRRFFLLRKCANDDTWDYAMTPDASLHGADGRPFSRQSNNTVS